MPHVNQLIVIAGPSCAGKSFLIKKIRKGAFPNLCEKIGITDPSLWRYTSIKDLKKSRESLIERLVVHCDIYSQHAQNNELNYLNELANNSSSTTILTLYVPPEIFVKRINSRIHTTLKSLLSLGSYKRLGLRQSLRRIYLQVKKRKAYIADYSMFLYKKWFLFFDQKSVMAHWILDFGFWILDFSKPNIAVEDLYKIDSCEPSEDVYELINS